MTDPQFTFASMIHRGFVADENATAAVTVAVQGADPVVHNVAMMTPGDVIGIPNRQVIRSTPANGLIDAEPNYLASVEFDSPDLPWMFSRTSTTSRTLPWISLAVIDETDLTADPLAASPTGTKLTVDAAQLPDPSQSWMWAHGQLLGTDTAPGDPTRSLSRLLSSRKLEPNRHYLACVVPVFAAGRDAGLGVDSGADGRTSMELAWTASGDVTLPVYYFWRFGTGPDGDFESLVRRLHGVPLPPGMGKRRLLLDSISTGLPAPDAAGSQLELHVALQPPESTLDDIAPLVGQSYLDVLASRLVDAGYDVSLLQTTPDAPPPVVGPPVYGQLQVGVTAAAAALATTAPPWVREINLDPRLRVAAGLGAEVVRQNQDRYVEEAWRQVGDVLAANALRRRAEFSVAASATLHRRWISALSAADLVTSTAPVHPHIFFGDDLTITGRLRESPVPPSIVSAEYRRITRQRGVLAGAADWRAAVGPTVLDQVSGAVSPLSVSIGLDTIDRLEAPSSVWGAEALPGILQVAEPDLDVTTLNADQVAARLDAAITIDPVQIVSASAAAKLAKKIDSAAVLGAIGMQQLVNTTKVAEAAADAATAATSAGHVTERSGAAANAAAAAKAATVDAAKVDTATVDAAKVDTTTVEAAKVDSATAHTGHAATVAHASTFDTAALGHASTFDTSTVAHAAGFDASSLVIDRITLPAKVSVELQKQISEVGIALIDSTIVASDAQVRPTTALDGGFESLRADLVTALEPSQSILRMVNYQISQLTQAQQETFDEIMIGPDLSEPTYRALADVSHDWLLPGIDSLPADTTTLVESNRSFIDAFLVGVNHELSRELTWREFPGDGRYTYSRQFWSRRSGAVVTDQYDLKHMLHEAPQLSLVELSENAVPAGTVAPAAAPLVLVVKGSLVHRYPGLLVTAAKTKKSGSSRTLDPATELQPDFMARLEPDVLLVGFDSLSATDVRTVGENENTAWWFFFAEHFTEPRFGLDVADAGGASTGGSGTGGSGTGGSGAGGSATTAPAALADWNDASWASATVDSSGRLGPASFTVAALPKSRPGAPSTTSFDWHGPSSSVAWILLQYPFRRGMRATDLLPPKPVS